MRTRAPFLRLLPRAASLLVLVALAAGEPSAAAPRPGRIPVLVLTGDNVTDWSWTSNHLRQVLEESGKFDVEVSLYPSGSLADANDLTRFRVLLLDYAGPRLGPIAEEHLLEALRGGTGVVAVHAACAAFSDWEAWGEVLGLACDPAPMTLPFGGLAVAFDDADHPITAGLGEWTAHEDLLPAGLRPSGAKGGAVLAEVAVDGRPLPILATGGAGDGRTVSIALGHVGFDPATRSSQTDPQFQQLLIRSVEWAATGRVSGLQRVEANTLTAEDRAEGWKLLFDGSSATGWESWSGEGFPEESWVVEGGCLKILPGEPGSDIATAERFEEFELEFEWRVAPDAEGTARLQVAGGSDEERLDRGLSLPVGSGVAEGDGWGEDGLGSRVLRPPGEFNHVRVVARHSLVEHWLNGVRILTLYVDPSEWAARVRGDRLTSDPELSALPLARLALRDDGTSVWFRNIRIRNLAGPQPQAVPGVEPEPVVHTPDLSGTTWVPEMARNQDDNPFHVTAEGLLECSGLPIGYLAAETDCTDYVIELDWRALPRPRKAPLGGVLLQITDQSLFWPRCVEVRLEFRRAGELWQHKMYPMTADRRRRGGNGQVTRILRDVENPLGQWNHLELRLEGGTLVVKVNGEVVNAASDIPVEQGRVALTAAGIGMQYRNIRLSPLR